MSQNRRSAARRAAAVFSCAVICSILATSPSTAGAREPDDSTTAATGAAIFNFLQSQPTDSLTAPIPGPVETRDVREAREESKTAYEDLTRGEARDLLEERQPEVAEHDGWVHPPLKPGQDLELLDADTARLIRADGSSALIESTVPLAFPEDGKLKEIDLNLEATPDGLEPAASPVDLTIPTTTADAVTVGEGDQQVGLSAVGAPPTVATQTDAGVLFANVANDTDFFVKPITGGVESFHVLRSADSPEEVSVRLDHPDGTSIRRDVVRGGYVIVDGDDAIAIVSDVVARDDTGRDVPVTTRLDGDILRIAVPHKGAGFTYPIVVDPDVVQTCWNAVTQSQPCQVFDWEHRSNEVYGNSYAGWNFYTPEDPDSRYAGHYAGLNSWLGAGLYIWDLGYYNFFRSGEWGSFWWYQAPPGVKIYAALFDNLSTDNLPENPTCSYVGIINVPWVWYPYSPQDVGGCARTTYDQLLFACDVNCQSANATYNNYAVFGVRGRGQWSSRWVHNVGAVLLYLTEPDPPAVRFVHPPDSSEPIRYPSQTLTINAGDGGVGLKKIDWFVNNASWTPRQSSGELVGQPCPQGTAGVTTLTCPQNAWQTVRLEGLAPGMRSISVRVKDALGHEAWASTWVNIDYYSTSIDYGGSDMAVNTLDEAESLGAALAAGATSSLWARLAPSDQNFMLTTADDSHYPTWSPRVDTQAPTVVKSVSAIDFDPATHTTTIAWSEGDDPDVGPGIYGSGVDDEHSVYRYRRAGAAWSSYRTVDTNAFDLDNVNVGDGIDVEVQEFDRAGNASPIKARTVVVPSEVVPTERFAFVLPVIGCVEYCTLLAAAGAGTVSGGAAYVINHFGHREKRFASDDDIHITRVRDSSETFDEAEARAKRQKGRLRRAGLLRDAPGTDRSGHEAHHVVGVTSRHARYARWVLYKCGLDPNDWDANGLWLPKKFHQKMHKKEYYGAVNDILWRYDPTFGADPCGESEEDGLESGLVKALNDIKQYILRGEFP